MQLQATTIAGEVTQRTNAEIVDAQAELDNPAPQQPQALHDPADEGDREVAWSTIIQRRWHMRTPRMTLWMTLW